MQHIRFLMPYEIIRIHASQINRFGGIHGIRDYGLLESATFEPQASFGGEYLYKDIFNMSAAYAYSIIKNHPFIDGNKRTGTLSALMFLDYNGYETSANQDQLFELAIAIAISKITIEEIASFLKKHIEIH
jgi:death on curing protein